MSNSPSKMWVSISSLSGLNRLSIFSQCKLTVWHWTIHSWWSDWSMSDLMTHWWSRVREAQTSSLWLSRWWLRIWRRRPLLSRVWPVGLGLKNCRLVARSLGWETNLRKSLTQLSNQTLLRHISQPIFQKTFRMWKFSPSGLKQV